MDVTPTPQLQPILRTASAVAAEVLEPLAATIDAEARWPAEAFEAFRASRLLGLQVPQRLGGHGQGLYGLARVTELLGRSCASTAMCFGMHCVGTAVMAAKATRAQEDRYLRPIAAGRHVTSLALSEAGTGSYFFIPETRIERDGDAFVVHGHKHFVTNGGQADSYVVSTRASGDAEAGEFNCLVVDAGTDALAWGDPWAGLGMRGNSSLSLRIDGARVPAENLLGEEGDEAWYVFEVVAPYFLTAMAGVYLGVAQAAYDTAVAHVLSRRHAHSGGSLAEVPTVQARVADLWLRIEQARLALYNAARLGDLGSPEALMAILGCKILAAEASVSATNEAMTLCGGIAYRENSTLSRLLRDARASHVMSPTTEMLRQWVGRTALGLPLL